MIGTGKWSDLFAKHDFFSRYRYYLQIIASSDSAARQLKWSGMIESRIRHLISKLESVDNLCLAHPFVKGFDKVHHCATEQEANDVSQGIYNLKPTSERSGTDSSKNGSENGSDTSISRDVHTTTFYVGLSVEPRTAGSTTAHRQLNLSWPTSEFTKLVKSWDKYDERYMGIAVKNVKSAQLPPEVFEEGGQRPAKLKRTKPGGKTRTSVEQPNKKRRIISEPSELVDSKMVTKVDKAADKMEINGESNKNVKSTRASSPFDLPSSTSSLNTRVSRPLESTP